MARAGGPPELTVLRLGGCVREEITNPGEPLVDTQRFVDTPPRSRNEALASLMRRFRIGVEERNRSTVSGLIREAVEAGVIVPADPVAAPKLMRYLPFWAAAPADGWR